MSDESSGAGESRRCKRVRMTVKLRCQGTTGDHCGCQKAGKAKCLFLVSYSPLAQQILIARHINSRPYCGVALLASCAEHLCDSAEDRCPAAAHATISGLCTLQTPPAPSLISG